MKLILIISLLTLTMKLNAQQTQPIQELRVYEIFDKNKQAFHDRFRDHAMRIMKKYNFKILSIWESKTEGKTEFVYLLEWKDEASMADSWKRFRADEEWIAIKKQTSARDGELVGKIEDRVLVKTNYSPQ